MAEKPRYALNPLSPDGTGFTGPGLPSAADQQGMRDRLLDPGMVGRLGPGDGNVTQPRQAVDYGDQPPVAIPGAELSGDTEASDYGRGLYKGLLDIAQGLAGTIELTGTVPVGTLTGKIATEAAEVIQNMSPSARVNLQRKWAEFDRESVYANPKAALLQLATVLPSVGASFGGAALGAAGAVGRLGRGASAVQRAQAAGRGGAIGAAGTEAAQVGGQTMTEIADMMNQVPHEQLMQQSDVYARNFRRSGSERQARNDTVLEASRSQAVGNALFSSLTAMLPGYVFGRLSQGTGPASRVRRAAQSGAVESAQEGVQEAGTALGTGLAYQQNIDSEFDPYGDLDERFAAGAGLGLGAGALVGAVTPGPRSDQPVDDLPAEIRAALPPPQGKLPAPEEQPEYGGELPAPQLRLPDLPLEVPDPNQAIQMGGAVQPTQGELDLAETGPAAPGAAMGPPQAPPTLDTTQRPGGAMLADDLIDVLGGRSRYVVLPANIDPQTAEAVQTAFRRTQAAFQQEGGDAMQGLVVQQNAQGDTIVTRQPQIAEAFMQGQQLPATTPDTNRAGPTAQQGFEFVESAPAPEPAPERATRPYPGGMTREQYEAADKTLADRRADRDVAGQLVERVRQLDAERVQQGEQPDLFGDEEKQPPPTQRKTAYGEQRKQMEKVARDAEKLAAAGTLDADGVAQALETLDRLAVTTDKTSPALDALTRDFDTVRQLTDQYNSGELGATEYLNYVNEMLGGKRGKMLKNSKNLKQVAEALAPEPKETTRSPSVEAMRKRIITAGENVAQDVKEPGGKKRGVMKQRGLFTKEEQADRLRGASKKQKELYEKRQAKAAREEQALQDDLAKQAERQYKAKQVGAARGAVNQQLDAQIEESTADERTLAALIAEQEADLAADEENTVAAEGERGPEAEIVEVADIEGRATGETQIEGKGDLIQNELFDESQTAKPAKRKRPKGGRKKEELSDEDKAWREAAAAAADATGVGSYGTTPVVGGAGRSGGVEDFIVPSTAPPTTLSSAAFKEQYPNAVEIAPHQLAGVNMILNRMNTGKKGVLVGDGTGAGKTLQAAVAADQARRNGKNVLMVTTGGANANVFPNAMKQLGVDMAGIEQKSYSTLQNADLSKYDVVVYDEAHNLKNVGGAFFQRFADINSDFNIFMSATPADMDTSLTLFALIQGKSLQQLSTELGLQTNDSGELQLQGIDSEAIGNLADMIARLAEEGAYYRRALPNITEYREVISDPDTVKYTDELTGESMTLREWDDRLAAAPGNNPGVFWARSAKLAETATYPSVIKEVDEALSEGRSVIVMSQRHEAKPVEWTSEDGTKHRLTVPSVLDMVREYLEDTGRGDLIETYYGKQKAPPRKFQSGEKTILLTTYGKASESIDLDDQVGDRPRTLISTLSEWSASTEDQARGRVDRASTKSVPFFRSMRADGFTADIVRASRLQSKQEFLDVMRGEESGPLTYENNTRTEQRGDRMMLTLTGMYYHPKKLADLKNMIKKVSGGFPNWKYIPARETHSIDMDVWPKVENAVKSVFEVGQISNLESDLDPEPTAPVEPVMEPTTPAENDMFFDRDAERTARDYEISPDDLVNEGTGPDGKVLAEDVERYHLDMQALQSQSFDLFNVERGVLHDTVPVLAKDLLMDIQKNTKRSSPMYDLLRTMIQRIGNTEVQLDEAMHHKYAGTYETRGDKIRINPRSNTNKTVMHEALHAVVGHTIETNPEFRGRVQKLRAEFLSKLDTLPRNELTEQMQSIVDTILRTTDENAHEFMSYALTEPEFQNVLKQMPSKFNSKQTLWQKFKAMVAKVLRLNRRARTAFDDLVDLAKDGATEQRLKDVPGAVPEQQFSMSFDSATDPIREAIRNYKGPQTRQQARSAARRKVTGLLTLRQLENMYEGVLDRLEMGNPVKSWIEALHRKEVTVKQFAAQGNKRYRDFRKVEAAHPEMSKMFRHVIHDSTVYQVYPNLAKSNPLNEGVSDADYNRLRKQYRGLPPAMQREFVRLYEYYRDERNFELKQQLVNTMLATEASLIRDDKLFDINEKNAETIADAIMEGNIDPLDLTIVVDGQVDEKLGGLLREAVAEKQAHSLARGPYFPLKRFGEFVAYGEKDRRTETASLTSDDLEKAKRKAESKTNKETGLKPAEYDRAAKLIYRREYDRSRRAMLVAKLNKEIAPYDEGNPGRQRGEVEFSEDGNTASRDHYDVYYAQHESAGRAEEDVNKLKEDGWTVPTFTDENGNETAKIGRRPDHIARVSGAYGPLLTAMRAKLESGKGSQGEYERLMKALEASLLATMPETSVRSEMLKRKNVKGWNEDAGRALAAHVRGAGYYRGQLLHGREISAAMANVNAAHSRVQRDNKYSQTDQDKVTAVMDEVRKHDAMDTAGNELGEISRGLANVGFLWVLLSPVYIFMNMTQPGMFTLPWLAARSKQGGATRAATFLKNAYSVVTPDIINRTKKARGGLFGLNFNVDQELFDFLDPDGKSVGRAMAKRILDSDLKYKDELVGTDGETGVLAELAAKNLLDMTLAADTRSAAAGNTQESMWERTLDSARIMPHLTEVLNRGVTAIAAYEMGRSEGMSRKDAQKFAEDAIAETQFDYTLLNKPRYMSERAYSLAKPIFMFMQHPQHVYALFVKSAMFGTRGAKQYYKLKRSGQFDPSNPDHAKAEQDYKTNRDTVMGILATHLLMGGVAGAMFEPAKWALGVGLLINEMLTGEPPEDTKTYVNRWLIQLAGSREGGNVLMHGLPWALAGLNFSNNLSLSTLATFDQRFPEGREGVQDRVFAALGPLPALAGNVAEGFKDIRDGDVMGGVARMSPRTLREMIRAANAADVGIQDSRGNTLIRAEDFSPYELAMSALGISTAEKSQMYKSRAATQNLKYGHRAKQNRLKERLRRADTPGKRRAAMAAIAKYNRTVPFAAQINIYGSDAASKQTQRQIDRGGGAPLGRKELLFKQEL